MKITITRKLFIGIFVCSLVVVISLVLVLKWSFDRGFIAYMDKVEQQKVMVLAARLENLYADWQSWDPIINQSVDWRILVQQAIGERRRNRNLDKAMESSPQGQRPPRRRGNDLGPRIVLFDQNGVVVIGRPEFAREGHEFPLLVNGQKIGHLSLAPRHRIRGALELELQSSIYRALLFVALLVAALSALMAWLLSRQLLKPVTALAAGTRKLAGGNYRTRVAKYHEDELGQLSDDFNHLAEQLQANLTSRQQWVADISHELRTPLAVLQGELEALQDGIRQVDESNLQSLHDEVLRLTSLVEQLYTLSLSDLGALSYVKEPLNVADLVESVVGKFAHRIGASDLSLEANIDDAGNIIVFADEDKIVQLLGNVLENSIRYTQPGGYIRVGVQLVDDTAQITIEDSAPGVEEEGLSRMFERLFRVHRSRNRRDGGAGLGLAICKNIVEAHDGKITADASQLGGVKIEIALPLYGQGR